MQAGLRHGAAHGVTNESAMYLPAKNTFLTSIFLFVALAATGCAKVSVQRANDAHTARGDDCSIAFEHASYAQVASDYEWLGEVTLRNERGVVLTEDDRKLLSAQACQLGGDTIVRTTGVKQQGSGVAAFSDQ